MRFPMKPDRPFQHLTCFRTIVIRTIAILLVPVNLTYSSSICCQVLHAAAGAAVPPRHVLQYDRLRAAARAALQGDGDGAVRTAARRRPVRRRRDGRRDAV